MRSSKRRAHTNSAANTPRASMMVSQPGPGVRIITIPRTSRVNPNRIFSQRLACCRDLISTFHPDPFGRCSSRISAHIIRRGARGQVSICTRISITASFFCDAFPTVKSLDEYVTRRTWRKIAGKSRGWRTGRSCQRAASCCLELVHDSGGYLGAHLIGSKIVACDGVNRNTQGHVAMVTV